MTKKPEFDVAAAHRDFSADCFNRAWDLIDKESRTAEETEQMIRLTLASAWHWSERGDATPTNLSVGYWQTSRVYAVAGQPDNARRYGELCLEITQREDVGPFYLGYAYEALARAEAGAGNAPKRDAYLALAREAAERVTEADDRKTLLDDLETIR